MTKRTLMCGVHPVLPAADVAATVLFYETQLGFVRAFSIGEPAHYVGVRRGMVELHIAAAENPAAVSGAQIRLQVENIEQIFREYVTRGLVAKNGSLITGPLNSREFMIRDPNGTRIVIYEDPAEEDDN